MAKSIAAIGRKTPNVAFVKKELSDLLPQYRLIRDCLAGETKIKAAGKLYLPMPNAEDVSPANLARYDAYKTRAMFFNATRRTLDGLLGQVFMRAPVVEAPSALQPVLDDATGAGVTLEQEAKRSLALVLAYSRSGLFVDFPDTSSASPADPEAGVTVADIQSGNVQATIYAYEPQQIINWRVIESGSRELLSLVVLHESYETSDDGFEQKLASQLRVLKLDAAGNYVQEIWRDDLGAKFDPDKTPSGNFKLYKTMNVTGGNGQPLKEIPFMFIGSDNNNSQPDNPNMYDIASINIGHYRNSADYEESVFIVGQPTPVVTGLSKEWLNDVLKGTIAFGSRGGIPLPTDATATLLQAEPNTMPKEAMEHKERLLTALGAKLVEQKSVQRTATEAKQDNTAEGSTLSSCANNVSSAYTWALKWCALFMNVTGECKYELNNDFDLSKMTAEEQNAAVKNWQAGALTFGEMRTVLRRAGTATEKDDKAKAEIEADTTKELEMQAKFEAESTPVPGGGE